MDEVGATAGRIITLGTIQVMCGLAISIADAIGLGLHVRPVEILSGVFWGLYYIVTGSFGMAAGTFLLRNNGVPCGCTIVSRTA
ncbi:uncharacterized protein LOC129599333 isoform X2 [Paramacrobiotus metropolitanus]|uniref:uncharacterized protein LOC129599333 isoform X2 n=1 Tax=Paramacrobiotus metropolitanus TaxID=2943436 RepID=UPI002445992F|nr:uncharacterized protein LOC129599333 isoform X2 [Paramacrobiotus metropolitanus]